MITNDMRTKKHQGKSEKPPLFHQDGICSVGQLLIKVIVSESYRNLSGKLCLQRIVP